MREEDVEDGRKARACLIFGVAMTALFAAMLFFMPSARAAGMLCTSMPNKDVLAHLEDGSKETLKFVGVTSTGEVGIPMEVTVSEGGTWTLLMLTPSGVCFMAVGTDWQAVEAKPPGIEN